MRQNPSLWRVSTKYPYIDLIYPLKNVGGKVGGKSIFCGRAIDYGDASRSNLLHSKTVLTLRLAQEEEFPCHLLKL